MNKNESTQTIILSKINITNILSLYRPCLLTGKLATFGPCCIENTSKNPLRGAYITRNKAFFDIDREERRMSSFTSSHAHCASLYPLNIRTAIPRSLSTTMTRPNVSVIADSFLQGDAVIDVPFLCLSGRPNL